MARVQQHALHEVLAHMPAAEVLSGRSLPRGRYDAFVCALGFEQRCPVIPQALADEGYVFDRAVYFEYDRNARDNQANAGQLLSALGRLADEVDPLAYSDTALFREVVGPVARARVGPRPSIVFDISAASNDLILRCMSVLLDVDVDLTLTYCEAAVYHPTREEFEADAEEWTSDDKLGLQRGVDRISTSVAHPGDHGELLPDVIVVFPTFSRDRPRALLSEVNPDFLTEGSTRVFWVLGEPHAREDAWRADAQRRINSLEEVPHSQCVSCSTFDYTATALLLERLYQEHCGDNHITIAPMGAKMQAVGTGLFCCARPDVRVMFAIPQEYNAERYSEGCKAQWVLGLGSTANLKTALRRVDNLAVVD